MRVGRNGLGEDGTEDEYGRPLEPVVNDVVQGSSPLCLIIPLLGGCTPPTSVGEPKIPGFLGDEG